MKHPKGYKLHIKGFIDPLWMNRLKLSYVAVVGHDYTVDVDGQLMEFDALALSRKFVPVPGTILEVGLLGSFFWCYVKAELDTIRRQQQEDEKKALSELKQIQNVLRARAGNCNQRIKLPVRWDTTIKDVLSGLSETSNGDGRKRNTVQHITLQEPLKAGRLRRETDDLLCASNYTANGKRYSGQTVERFVDGDGNPYQPEVTCKQCLVIAHRIARRNS